MQRRTLLVTLARGLTLGAGLCVTGLPAWVSLAQASRSYRQGPAGDPRGARFSDHFEANDTRLAAVSIWHGERILGIRSITGGIAGATRTHPRHGIEGGTRTDLLLGADEYVTAISGRTTDWVASLRLHKSRRQTGRMGTPDGVPEFIFNAPPDYQIGGFFGRADDKGLRALGVILRPLESR